MDTPSLLQQERARRARVRAERKLLLQQTMIRRKDIQEQLDAAQRVDVESTQNVKKS
jgi:hypothetical protein